MTRPDTTCSSCGALIFWARTTRGNRIPIDANPVANGNLRLDGVEAHVVPIGQGTHVSHFANCPNAGKHRK
jgi:hypothetical protein